jgi:hypothetical protein
MKRSTLLCLALLSAGPAGAQSIEGFWQDTERRILYSADAPPGFEYGRWTALDPNQTYPSAKQIRKGAGGVEVVDFLYDEEEVLTVRQAGEKSIEFTRASTWSRCSVLHRCDLQGSNEMLCALETSCSQQVVWRGEERYARRASCERVEVRRAQGIPHRCR